MLWTDWLTLTRVSGQQGCVIRGSLWEGDLELWVESWHLQVFCSGNLHGYRFLCYVKAFKRLRSPFKVACLWLPFPSLSGAEKIFNSSGKQTLSFSLECKRKEVSGFFLGLHSVTCCGLPLFSSDPPGHTSKRRTCTQVRWPKSVCFEQSLWKRWEFHKGTTTWFA